MTDKNVSELSLLLMTALDKLVMVRKKNTVEECDSPYIIVEKGHEMVLKHDGIDTPLFEGNIINQIAEVINN